jgi:hypothetical protein
MPPNVPTLSLGTSLRISNGDLIFVNGDFSAVTGQDNFLQGMQVMIETPFASDIFNVSYGFDLLNILGQAQPPGVMKEFIRLNIVKSISTDNRVRDIEEIAFSDEARFFELAPQADAATTDAARRLTRRWEAIVVLNTVSNQNVAVGLTGAGG